MILAERIRAAITKPFAIEGHDIQTGTSIGITIYPDDSVDSAQVLKNADMALYRAKARERGTYEFYSRELGRTAQKRLDIAAGLRRALAVGEELSLVFQPKFSLDTGHAIGVEALLRWDRPGHEPISPAEFIPVAEATGLILPIGEWVLRRACEHLKGWRDAGVPMVPLSVNLSAAQFRDQTLVDKIKCCLDDFTIDPAMLEIEITETALMHDAEPRPIPCASWSESGSRFRSTTSARLFVAELFEAVPGWQAQDRPQLRRRHRHQQRGFGDRAGGHPTWP